MSCNDCQYLNQKISIVSTRLQQRLNLHPELNGKELKQQSIQTDNSNYQSLIHEIQLLNSQINKLMVEQTELELLNLQRIQRTSEANLNFKNAQLRNHEFKQQSQLLQSLQTENQTKTAQFNALVDEFRAYKQAVVNAQPENQKARLADVFTHVFEQQLPAVLQSLQNYSLFVRLDFDFSELQPQFDFFFLDAARQLSFKLVDFVVVQEETTFRVDFQLPRVAQGQVPFLCVDAGAHQRLQQISQHAVQFVDFRTNQFKCEVLDTNREKFLEANLLFLEETRQLTIQASNIFISEQRFDCFLLHEQTSIESMKCFCIDAMFVTKFAKFSYSTLSEKELLLVVRIGSFLSLLRFQSQNYRDMCYLFIKRNNGSIFNQLDKIEVKYSTSSLIDDSMFILGQNIELPEMSFVISNDMAYASQKWTLEHLLSKNLQLIVLSPSGKAQTQQISIKFDNSQSQNNYQLKLIFRNGKTEVTQGTMESLQYLCKQLLCVLGDDLICSDSTSYVQGPLDMNIYVVTALGSNFGSFAYQFLK